MKIKRHIHTLLVIILVITTKISAYSQEGRLGVLVHFYANSTQIEPKYKDNSSQTLKLITFLHQIQADSTINIINVSFFGAASPEGNYELNRNLAKERMGSLKKFICNEIEIPDSIITYNNDSYIQWEYLSSLVKESDMLYKNDILEIINEEGKIVSYIGGKNIDIRVLHLMALDNGKVWKELNRRYFDSMRNACAIFITSQKTHTPILNTEPGPTAIQTESFINNNPDSIVYENYIPIPPSLSDLDSVQSLKQTPAAEIWRRQFLIKTNVLGWGLAIANIALEIDFCNHFSFSLPVYYSSWNYFTSDIKFRTFSIQPEIRYWFSEKDFCNDNWFIGAHFGLAFYNVAVNGEFRWQDYNRNSPALGGGIAAGYRMPITKNKRWKMEFSVGAGIYGLHYDKFYNYSNGPIAYTDRKKTYIGIDQASVSFSYVFNLKK